MPELKTTLYLTRNGLLEPLGQSQILAYLQRLAAAYSIILITFEKDEDWAESAEVSRLRERCASLGIIWMPQRFRRRPRFVSPAWSMFLMFRLSLKQARHREISLIHARSYLPAAVALVVSRLTAVPFIFDMRALWPEELITAGRLRRGSLMHWLITAAEAACLSKSAAVVSLTEGAANHLKAKYPEALADKTVFVIPTCADLARFVPAEKPALDPVHGCIGTLLSGWFQTDWLRGWIDAVSIREPRARFEILTREDPRMVKAAIDPDDQYSSKLSVSSRQPSEMPEAIQRFKVSVMFFTAGLGKLGSSPTRMGEILGAGLPVVANDGVGDVPSIIRNNRVGVVVEGNTRAQMIEAYDALSQLLQDPQLSERCRATASAIFSLEEGSNRYLALYKLIIK